MSWKQWVSEKCRRRGFKSFWRHLFVVYNSDRRSDLRKSNWQKFARLLLEKGLEQDWSPPPTCPPLATHSPLLSPHPWQDFCTITRFRYDGRRRRWWRSRRRWTRLGDMVAFIVSLCSRHRCFCIYWWHRCSSSGRDPLPSFLPSSSWYQNVSPHVPKSYFQFSRLPLLHCSFPWWICGASFRWGSCTSSVRSEEVVIWWLEFIHHLQNCSSAAVHPLFHRSDRAQVFFSWYVFIFCH